MNLSLMNLSPMTLNLTFHYQIILD